MIKTLIVDDHSVVREGLKKILSEAPNITVADEASTGHEVLKKIKDSNFDVIVLDVSLPDINGLDVLKQIRSTKPDLPVLIFSIYPEERYAIRFLRAGASGYLTKKNAPEELIRAIRKISQGRKYITSFLAEKLVYDLGDDNKEPLHEKLSDREFQVMIMIALGKRAKEIAKELFLSEKTINNYKSRILEKMKMKNNAEIIHYAMREGLID